MPRTSFEIDVSCFQAIRELKGTSKCSSLSHSLSLSIHAYIYIYICNIIVFQNLKSPGQHVRVRAAAEPDLGAGAESAAQLHAEGHHAGLITGVLLISLLLLVYITISIVGVVLVTSVTITIVSIHCISSKRWAFAKALCGFICYCMLVTYTHIDIEYDH